MEAIGIAIAIPPSPPRPPFGRLSEKFQTRTPTVAATAGDEESAQQPTTQPTGQNIAKQTTEKTKEYIHIEYHAWEFQAAEVLWGALVDKIFYEVTFAVGECGTFDQQAMEQIYSL